MHRFFLFFMALTISAPAAELDPIGQIMDLARKANVIILTADMGASINNNHDGASQNNQIREIRAQLDQQAPAALTAAKSNPDLARAVREFYQAAIVLFEAGAPINASDSAQLQPLERAFKAKRAALELELKAR